MKRLISKIKVQNSYNKKKQKNRQKTLNKSKINLKKTTII